MCCDCFWACVQVPRQHQTELPSATAAIEDDNKKTYCVNSIERIEANRKSLAMDMKSRKSAILDFTKQLGATDNSGRCNEEHRSIGRKRRDGHEDQAGRTLKLCLTISAGEEH